MALSTAQRVADQLRDRIQGGGLPPGTQLSEEALGRDLGVSRNTLREAFRLLIHESLVVHRLNRGVFVRVPEAADVTDVYRVRAALETAGVRAAERAPWPLRQAVAEAVDRGERAAARGDWREVGSADLRFHRALAALSGSPRIDSAMDRLLAELRLAFHAMPSPRRFHEPFLPRNRALAGLLERGEYGRAEAELLTYLDDARQLILDAMRETSS
ncbi:GntR family transcriptional regulator [Streptomyces eurocidicus]|uniref:GntR family transcriptional regulator n=1 Tax=Streptomyces eurocidicus TaxID=66423 RepID=A0A2N8NMT9_STREU|nr:GntR family transcriptional regulator [Streptomyces eurocidicus]MBB5118284.1 DNA-binding GntR family transcriptional regulator [Streptomyces eurocidicus]MBF6054659.1 FCD domain-containing protein [Streptomyces eurocidicus]PNE30089.1 GntR family transcriptional regulator [Streptomyces eurocidicus]